MRKLICIVMGVMYLLGALCSSGEKETHNILWLLVCLACYICLKINETTEEK